MVAEDSTFFSVVATGELPSLNAKATPIKFSDHTHRENKKAGDTLGRELVQGGKGERG